MNYLKNSKNERQAVKKDLLHLLWLVVFSFLVVGASAQKPFHEALEQRIHFLNTERQHTITDSSLAVVMRLRPSTINSIRKGKAEITDRTMIAKLAYELQCTYRIVYRKGSRYIILVPNEEKRDHVYSKSTGHLEFIK